MHRCKWYLAYPCRIRGYQIIIYSAYCIGIEPFCTASTVKWELKGHRCSSVSRSLKFIQDTSRKKCYRISIVDSSYQVQNCLLQSYNFSRDQMAFQSHQLLEWITSGFQPESTSPVTTDKKAVPTGSPSHWCCRIQTLSCFGGRSMFAVTGSGSVKLS